ncbi:unnamed protein product [Rhizophagus irregularis]|nr:unnamed protein product [Rhizophagus irregularis]
MGRGKHNSSSMLCKCCYSGENAINFSSLFLVKLPPFPCGSATTAPLRGSATTAPLRGSATTAPLRGSATTAPLRGSATTAPLRGSATTAPLRGSATTAPLRGSATTAPLRGSATTAPLRGSATTAPLRGSATTAPLRGSVTTAPLRGSATTAPLCGSATTLPFCAAEIPSSLLWWGDITGLSTHEVEKYVEEATKFNFIHVVKEEGKGTRRQASLFYIQTRNKSYQYDEDRGPFKFYAAKYFNSDRKVNYTLDEEADINDENKPKKRKVIEIIDDDLSSEENSETIQQAREGTYPVAKEAANITGEHVKDFSEGRKGFQETAKGGAKQLATQFKPLNVAYGLYENDSSYILVLHTPGIENKSDLMVTSINDKFIIINGSFNGKVAGKVGQFEAQVDLPNKIEAISAKIEVEHGISTITLRKIYVQMYVYVVYYGSTYLDPKKCKANNFDPIKKIGMSSMGKRASADDQNSQKRDEERRSSGRKIDAIKEKKEEFSITEISGPPAQKDWSHFTGDQMKIVKMLKTLMNRYAMLCLNSDIRIVKLYGMQFTVSQ